MSPGAAGLDLLADVAGGGSLAPGERALVPTGIAVALPPATRRRYGRAAGWRCGTASDVLNRPGPSTPITAARSRCSLVNLGHGAATVRRGERVAQLVVAPVTRIAWREVGGAAHERPRGDGGFGSRPGAAESGG